MRRATRLFFCLSCISAIILVLSSASAGETRRSGRHHRGHKSHGDRLYCPRETSVRKVAGIASSLFGASRASCFMRMFMKETGAQPTCYQPKGHARNPNAGYGLCTLEHSRAIRNRRGGACARNIDGRTDEGIKNQMLCCNQLQHTRQHYFGRATRRAMGRSRC